MIKSHIEQVINDKIIIDGIYCNKCGRQIKNKYGRAEASIFGLTDLTERLSIEKHWGYNSQYDGEVHNIDICEDCYAEWIGTFSIPVESSI
jgi:predicted transposase YbfD/YdcC